MKLSQKPKVALRVDLVKITVVGVALLSIIGAWVFFFGGMGLSHDSSASTGTIPSGASVSANTNPFSNLSSGDTIRINGVFTINADYTTHSSNIINVIVDGQNAEIKVLNNRKLVLGTGSSITLLNGGSLTSTGSCPSSAEIYFGSTLVANCPGTGGANSFDDINSSGGLNSSGGMLPVSWANMSLKADDDRVNIYWSTASEENNSRFEVEFSDNGLVWDKINTIETKAPNGNSVSLLNYQTVHYPPMSSEHLMYRIKQIDFDGKSDYSKVMMLERATENNVKVGTLGDASINIRIGSDFGYQSTVRIYNTSGDLIVQEEMNENQNFTLPESGVYIIEVASGSKVERIKHLVR